jgi:hypothetical protein
MFRLEDRLINQEGKIQYLREIIATGRLKFGIPPIVPLTCIPDTIGSRFMTYQELQEYKGYMNAEVETLYMKENITNRLLSSESQVPFFGESKDQVRVSFLEEESEEVDREEEEEGQRQRTSLTPTGTRRGTETYEEEEYSFGEEGEEEEDDYPYIPGTYPINFIPDDQMPSTDPEEDYTEEEEDYMTDPIPIARPEMTGERTEEEQERRASQPQPPPPPPQIPEEVEPEEEEEMPKDAEVEAEEQEEFGEETKETEEDGLEDLEELLQEE